MYNVALVLDRHLGVTEVSVRSGRDLVDGSTGIQMEYSIAHPNQCIGLMNIVESVGRYCDLVDGSTCILMEYIIAWLELPSTRSRSLLQTDSSVRGPPDLGYDRTFAMNFSFQSRYAIIDPLRKSRKGETLRQNNFSHMPVLGITTHASTR